MSFLGFSTVDPLSLNPRRGFVRGLLQNDFCMLVEKIFGGTSRSSMPRWAMGGTTHQSHDSHGVSGRDYPRFMFKLGIFLWFFEKALSLNCFVNARLHYGTPQSCIGFVGATAGLPSLSDCSNIKFDVRIIFSAKIMNKWIFIIYWGLKSYLNL